MATRKLLALGALVEAGLGLTLMAYPPIVTLLLLGDRVSGAAMVVGRVGGLALVSLAVACWPEDAGLTGRTARLRAMLVYNVLITLYLLSLGVDGEMVGTLLWPACGFHAVLTALFGRAWFVNEFGPGSGTQPESLPGK